MEINITENIYDFSVEDLMIKGNRINNSKRNFLFISKVLGKHIEVKPSVCRAIGFLLASRLYGENSGTSTIVDFLKNQNNNNNKIEKEKIEVVMRKAYRNNENICVLGFAETATGLGMAVASAIENSYYITTTRENIKDIKSLLNFEEEHSHATTHKCFPREVSKIINADRIILVDDEITTGKSMINIIRELKKNTKVTKYTILSILDWRNKEYIRLLEDFVKENNIEVEVKSIISGEVVITDNTVFYDNDENIIEETTIVQELNILTKRNEYLKYTGRFGVDYKEILNCEEECIKAAEEINKFIGESRKILVLGHGENIYIPARIAAHINGEVYYKSTTRSPIYCKDSKEYPIKEKNIFFDRGVKYYFYNKSQIEKEYHQVILIVENNLDIKLTNNLIIVKP